MKINKIINKIINNFFLLLKHFISPPFCAYCRVFITDYTTFCLDCTDLIKPIISTSINISFNYKLVVHAVSDYQEPIKTLVLAKSQANTSYSLILAQLVFKYSNLKNLDFDYLIPVPLHWTRKAFRGYNQSEVMAKELSRLTKKPILKCIKRKKRTVFQYLLAPDQRKSNLKDAFILSDTSQIKHIENKRLMLVDDLMTTGSTLKELSKTLVKYNPKELQAIVACRVKFV